MANKKISELQSRTPSLTDLLLVGDPSSGYSYKCTVTALATIIETDIADGYVTIGTTQTISGAKTFSNNLTLTSVSNANTDTDKFLVLNGSNIVNFRTGAEVLSDIGGQGALTLTTTGTSGAATLVSNVLNIPQYQGVISLASIGSSPNANGATLSSNTLTLQPASGSFGGVVTTGFQEFAGQKRFIGNPIQFDKHLEVKNIDSWGVSWGYTSLASKDTPVFGFLRGHSFVGTVTYYAWFTYGSTGERNYTLPSTDGTLALTSDITSSISGTTNYIPKFTGSNSIGNSAIYDNSGKIGINTTAPLTKLDVKGVDGTAIAYFYNNTTTAGQVPGVVIEAGTNSSDYSLDVRSSGGTSYLRVNGNGNVGIGTTSPKTKVDILSAGGTLPTLGTNPSSANLFLTDNGLWGMYFGLDNSTGKGYIQQMRNDGATSYPLLLQPVGGNVGIGTTSPGNKLTVAGNIEQTSTANIVYTNNIAVVSSSADMLLEASNANIRFNSGSSERMRITSAGNVGIGTTTPQLNLHIFTSGTSFTSSTVTYSSATSRGILLDNSAGTNQSGNAIWFANSGLYSAIASTRESTGDWGTDIRFYTHPTTITNQYDVTERMRITSSGNVGIGTTSPGTTLHTFGRIRSSNTNTSGAGDAAGVYELGDNSNGLWRGAANSITTAGNYTHIGGYDGVIFTASNASIGSQSERMRITSGGDVGIGVTSPGAKLEVNGAIKTSNPSGGTAKPWKLGEAVSTAVTLSGYAVVEIDGVAYKLALVTAN